MSEAKTKKPRVTISVEDFLAGLEPQRQKEAIALAEMMERVTGWPPAMWSRNAVGFGRLTYKNENGRKVPFS